MRLYCKRLVKADGKVVFQSKSVFDAEIRYVRKFPEIVAYDNDRNMHVVAVDPNGEWEKDKWFTRHFVIVSADEIQKTVYLNDNENSGDSLIFDHYDVDEFHVDIFYDGKNQATININKENAIKLRDFLIANTQ